MLKIAMRKVWVTQCLCPGRHCILAAADEAESEADAKDRIEVDLRGFLTLAVETGVIGTECGICAAPRGSWVFETRSTVFKTLGDAMPVLRQLEQNQLMTKEIWGDTHKTERPN